MITKFKTTLLVFMLFFGLVSTINAQDNSEFAVVVKAIGFGKTDGIYVYCSGKEVEYFEVNWEKVNGFFDFTPYLNKIQKMSEEGWEVITIDDGFCYLKRKKN